ncbi:DUF5131 family protein [Pseudomonas aeruginosa]
MADKTKIEWTDATWNPIRGCSRVSEGCRYCYAETVAARVIAMDRGRGIPAGQGAYDELLAKGGQWNGRIKVVESVMDQPLRWRKPRLIFVNSMSDLFHENVPLEVIDQIFAVMLACAALNNRKHTFQVLTKRPERMREYLLSRTPSEHLKTWALAGDGLVHMQDENVLFSEHVAGLLGFDWDENGENSSGSEYMAWGYTSKLFPLPNVWLGVSIEDQAAARDRIPLLLETPAAVRWLSVEPLLGPVDLQHIKLHTGDEFNALYGWHEPGTMRRVRGVDWVVVGGESGPNARPMHPEWAFELRDQCAADGVPFLFKQWGEWRPPLDGEEFSTAMGRTQRVPAFIVAKNGTVHCFESPTTADGALPMLRVGKQAAGRLLDGQLFDGYPTTLDSEQANG